MKIFLILFAVLFLGFVITHVFAQKIVKPREVIVIEVFTSDDKEPSRNEILINRTPREGYGVGGAGNSACGECTLEQINAQPSSYLYTARAFRMGKDKANVGFEIEVDEECKTRKIFTVYRNQQTKIKLNCGVSLTAYYGLESKEEN